MQVRTHKPRSLRISKTGSPSLDKRLRPGNYRSYKETLQRSKKLDREAKEKGTSSLRKTTRKRSLKKRLLRISRLIAKKNKKNLRRMRRRTKPYRDSARRPYVRLSLMALTQERTR